MSIEIILYLVIQSLLILAVVLFYLGMRKFR